MPLVETNKHIDDGRVSIAPGNVYQEANPHASG
jgi:hypothetical protein